MENPRDRKEYMRRYRIANRAKLNAQNAKWQAENSETYKECQRRYREQNRERIRERSRRWAKAFPEKLKRQQRAAELRRRYGISLSDFEKMIEAQKGLCALCGIEFSRSDKPNVDHDHETGKIRGILHRSCNTMLGLARDSVLKLSAAIEYVTRHRRDRSLKRVSHVS